MEAKLGECVICERVVVLTRLERCEECFRLEYIVQKDLPGVLKILEQLGMTVLEWIPLDDAKPDYGVQLLTKSEDFLQINSRVGASSRELLWSIAHPDATHWARVVLP